MPIGHSIGGATAKLVTTPRPVLAAMLRGARLICPSCGEGAMFGAYLKVNDCCPQCGEALHHHRADDAPPYFTMLIVGHIVVGAMLTVEMNFSPPMWMQMAAWPVIAIALCLLLLPVIKGTLIGLQWAMRMHGFDRATGVGAMPDIDHGPTSGTKADGPKS